MGGRRDCNVTLNGIQRLGRTEMFVGIRRSPPVNYPRLRSANSGDRTAAKLSRRSEPPAFLKTPEGWTKPRAIFGPPYRQ